MLPIVERERGSLEYVDADISVQVNGTPVDPPDTYEVSATPDGEQATEADWHAAPWLTSFTDRGDYLVRVRFTDNPEQPVARAYWLRIT